MWASTALIDKNSTEFLGKLSQYLDILYYPDLVCDTTKNLLICVSKQIKSPIHIHNLSINQYSNYNEKWEKSDYSPPIGLYNGDWININNNTNEIEIHTSDYYDFSLLYKVCKHGTTFLCIFLHLAKNLQNKLEEVVYNNQKMFGFDIYQRRELCKEFTKMAGGREYREFWKQFWCAWSDKEIVEAGTIGYDLDLPTNIHLVNKDGTVDMKKSRD